jgi:hypothetical protein
MRKLTDKAIFKFIELKVWLHQKKEGSTWDKFIFGVILIATLIVTSKILGFILK